MLQLADGDFATPNVAFAAYAVPLKETEWPLNPHDAAGLSQSFNTSTEAIDKFVAAHAGMANPLPDALPTQHGGSGKDGGIGLGDSANGGDAEALRKAAEAKAAKDKADKDAKAAKDKADKDAKDKKQASSMPILLLAGVAAVALLMSKKRGAA